MKKTLTVMTLLAGAVSVYSQGSIGMNDYSENISIQVFTAQSVGASPVVVSYGGHSGLEEQGNSANNYNDNPGSTVYSTGAPLGTGYSVGLLALDGGGASLYSQLTATSFVTSAWLNSAGSPSTTGNGNYGMWNTTSFATVPGNAQTASIAIAAWQNTGGFGAATTLAAAQADGYAWGIGNIVTATLATGSETPVYLPASLTDFSLITTATPEPSTIALGVIGASALLFRRRK